MLGALILLPALAQLLLVKRTAAPGGATGRLDPLTSTSLEVGAA